MKDSLALFVALNVRVYLKDYRFLMTLVGLFVLMTVGAWLFVEDQARRLERYDALVALSEERRDLERVFVPQRPGRLGFVSREPRERFLEYAVVRPYLADVPSPDASQGPLVSAGQVLDWHWIFVYFYSFMAIVLTHDAISGEKETGTLKMVLSRPASRAVFLLGKYLGSYTVLLLPAVTGTLASLLVVSAAGAELRGSDYLACLAAFLVLAGFLSFTVLVGLAVSTLARRASSALALALGAWVAFAFVLPAAVATASEAASDVPAREEFQRDLSRLVQDMYRNVTVESRWLQEIVERPGLTPAEKRAAVAELEAALQREHEEHLARHEVAMARLRQDHLARVAARRDLHQHLGLVSPFDLVGVSLDHVAGSGWSGRSSFLRRLSAYQRSYTRFVEQSREKHRDQAAESSMYAEVEDSDGEVYRLTGLGGISYAGVDVSDADFPVFGWMEDPLSLRLSKLFVPAACLVLYQVGLVALLWWRFRSYDLR